MLQAPVTGSAFSGLISAAGVAIGGFEETFRVEKVQKIVWLIKKRKVKEPTGIF